MSFLLVRDNPCPEYFCKGTLEIVELNVRLGEKAEAFRCKTCWHVFKRYPVPVKERT